MSGVAGGAVHDISLKGLGKDLQNDAAEPIWLFQRNGNGIGLTANATSGHGEHTWTDNQRAGIVYGAITNQDEKGWAISTLFDQLFERPMETASTLEGEFLIAAYDADAERYLLVTDKLGARSCYYTTDGPFRFATEVSPLVTRLDSTSVDTQAVSDMLLMGHLWGELTLVEEVRTMRPATVMEVTDDGVSATRYWKPDYDEATPGNEYITELARRYRQAAKRAASTFPREAGIWLSGGLDSRTTAAALLEQRPSDGFESLRAFTYDANPPTNDNPRIATVVCDELGIDYTQVPLSAETFAPALERVIEVTDGMIAWNTLVNLSATYNITEVPHVLFEGMAGELLGDHLLRYHLYKTGSAVQAQYESEAGTSASTVQRILDLDVDPYATLKTEAERSQETTHRSKVLDIHFQNFYARHLLASNNIIRDVTDSHAIQVDGDYLEWCARLPRSYRKGTFPLTRLFVKADAGGVPYGTSRAKLKLCREITPSLAEIKYERTQTKPKRPYVQHVAGFVANVVTDRLRGKPTYGMASLPDIWLRDESTELHDRVSRLIDSARSRSIFREDVIADLYDGHMDGDNNISTIAKVTTVEYWLQQYID